MTEKITLTGAAETLLGTLHGRAMDALSPHPVLGDRTAVEMSRKLDYDFRHLGIRPSSAVGIAVRAKLLDRWTREFLRTHPHATVLHLGCGLDSRVQRVDPGPGVRWFDVDQPQVIELRNRMYEPRPGHRTIAASVTDPAWLSEVPADPPVLVVAEGLTMYLPATEGPALLRRLVGHFSRGQIAFDTYSRLAVRLAGLVPVLRRTGARLGWGIDDPRSLEQQVPGIRLIGAVGAFAAADPADLARAPGAYRVECGVLGRLPLLRGVGHIARYAFG